MRAVSANFADKKLGLGMAGVRDFHTLRQQPFPAPLAPPREGRPAAFRAHAGAKTVLIFSGALRALESPFHDVEFWRGATLGRAAALSIPSRESGKPGPF